MSKFLLLAHTGSWPAFSPLCARSGSDEGSVQVNQRKIGHRFLVINLNNGHLCRMITNRKSMINLLGHKSR